MSDPTFETREELQAWEKDEVRRFQAAARSASVAGGLITGMIKVANRIERVHDAHAHLLGATPSKGTPCVDWDETDMPDGAEPLFMDCGTLREAADAITALRAEVERMREALAFIGHLATCDHGHAHYCPNCDRSLFEIGDTVQTALTQTKDTTDDA